MALLITDECINCDVCEPQCPNDAISMGAEIYEIDPRRCTECIGHFDEPQCRVVCPVDCIPVDPARIESHDVLLKRYFRLHPDGEAAGAGSDADAGASAAVGVGVGVGVASGPSGKAGSGSNDPTRSPEPQTTR